MKKRHCKKCGLRLSVIPDALPHQAIQGTQIWFGDPVYYHNKREKKYHQITGELIPEERFTLFKCPTIKKKFSLASIFLGGTFSTEYTKGHTYFSELN